MPKGKLKAKGTATQGTEAGKPLDGKGLKAKGAPTQGTRVEEPERTDHQFLCTKEVGTP